MSRHPPHEALPPARLVADKVFSAFERFLHVEAVSGVVLLAAAAAALIWANSPAAESYHQVWHAPLSIGIGAWTLAQPLHFWINDGLMTVFFLVVGMEIRREIHEGALATLQIAALPIAAAIGGVVLPALIYLGFNTHAAGREGWAVPTATDIAFAVGVLALLGRSIPAALRVFLLALAIIDDIAAVLIIALFYSGGLDFLGLLLAGAGVLLALGLQHIGVGTAYAYIVPAVIVWLGLLQAGAHPTLAGVVLGLITPVRTMRAAERPVDAAARALNDLDRHVHAGHADPRGLIRPLQQLRHAQRELLPPVVRVQMALHPWVAYAVMPLFALANAGVDLQGIDFAAAQERHVTLGVVLGLVVGKPAGIVLVSWIAVRLRWCRLAPDVTWLGLVVIGCLAGIGFTMSIFIANLAFGDEGLLMAAKLGVLLASATAGMLGLVVGRCYIKGRQRRGEYPEGR